MADIVIKSGDTGPAVTATLKDANDDPINLTSSTVKFVMQEKNGNGDVKVNADGTVTDAPNGRVSYQWAEGDTDTAGEFQAEWRVTDGGGNVTTVPNTVYMTVRIYERLG